MITFSEISYVQNNSVICLSNIKNKLYLNLDNVEYKFKANGIHPFLINKDFDNTSITDFRILLSSNPKAEKILTYGNQVSIMSRDDMFISCTNNGEVRLENLRGDKILNSMNLPVNSKFTIIDPFNQTNISKPLLYNDEIILRSTFGTYLAFNQDLIITSSSLIISEDTIWKIIKTDIPYLPDWLSKRKFLNYNYISYLYNLEKTFENSNNQNIIKKNKTNPIQDEKLSLLTLGLEKQEKLLIEDLLLNMVGLEGNYIKRNTKKLISNEKDDPANIYKNISIKFEVEPYLENPTCDPSLLYMVYKIIPLSNYYDRITNYINLNGNIETGLISKGLSEGLRNIIREYILFINQLEGEFHSDNLDIQKLWYLCQPSIKILENLQKLCYQASLVKGGALLNILYNFLQNTTDSELKKLYKCLLDKAIEPYFEMLKLWVCKGFLNDKFCEFLVISNKNYNIEILKEYYYDLFWEKKFILCNINIPEFFNNFSDKIFFIGKTLNILRECNKVVNCPYEKEFESFLNKNNSIYESDILINFQNLISKIYEWANITLKNLLFKEENLYSVFKSIKKFYFMECGDFYTHLLDLTDDLLLLERNKIKFEKFENIIDNAIRSTSANLDFNKELFTFNFSNMIIRTEKIYLDRFIKILELNDIPLLIKNINELNKEGMFFDYDDSKIIESLVLDLNIKWPLNLIFTKKSLIKYKILFRQLLFLKYEEKKLSESWILQQNFKEFKFHNLLKPSYLLRDKMINFVKNLIYYFFNEVIEPNYINFIENLLKSKSIEDIITSHDNFLNICLKECLLENADILILINEIIQTCLVYSKIIIKYYNSASLNEKYISSLDNSTKYRYISKYERIKEKKEEQDKILEEIFLEQKFLKTVDKFIKSFEDRLELFLMEINKINTKQNPHLINLLTKLDYNNYYYDKFSRK